MTQTLPAPPRTLRALRPSGTVWAALRLHRIALWGWLALVLATSGLLLWLLGPGADAAARQLARCAPSDCEFIGGPSFHYDQLLRLVGAFLYLTPYIAALFMGAVCVGRELERGTAQLAWVQSVSPARWLATTVGVPAAWFLAGMVPLVTLHHLVWATGPGPLIPWHDEYLFLGTGPLAPARVLLGLAVGALGGVLFRKALAGGVAGVAALLMTGWLSSRYRVSLWPTVTEHGALPPVPPADSQVLRRDVVTAAGERVTNDLACVDAETEAKLRHCARGFQDFSVTYHPPSHYWPLQLTEAAGSLLLTAAATALAFTLLRRHTP
ncbi:ABC transporter permease [Streptomyces sp. NPDC001904]|uniref:ABC transporter permease n=1 Tax=Streptomyces sp. NPDC001904 TaxID=3154531 RepID=UPI0033286091